MVHQFFLDKRPHNGLTHDEYVKRFQTEIENTNPDNLNEEEKRLLDYKKLNFQRSTRIEKQFVPSDELKEIVNSIEEHQLWMVITENWCGDSAQNLPVIANIASVNTKINFRIILRDSNPDIMDEYLTNGSMSIPKLVVFDEDGNELFTWGPRPKAAQELFLKLRDEGMPKPDIYEGIHAWYGKNKGEDLEKELIELIKKEELTH
jgi:Thioredoxin